jgi:hypothetical protein
MATDVREFREGAAILCRSSWCPACKARVYPALQVAPDLILCPCERCGYMLGARDLGDAGEYLTMLDDDVWRALLVTHGLEIVAIRRAIVMDPRDPPEPAPVAAPWLAEFLSIAAGAACFAAFTVWFVWSFVRR